VKSKPHGCALILILIICIGFIIIAYSSLTHSQIANETKEVFLYSVFLLFQGILICLMPKFLLYFVIILLFFVIGFISDFSYLTQFGLHSLINTIFIIFFLNKDMKDCGFRERIIYGFQNLSYEIKYEFMNSFTFCKLFFPKSKTVKESFYVIKDFTMRVMLDCSVFLAHEEAYKTIRYNLALFISNNSWEFESIIKKNNRTVEDLTLEFVKRMVSENLSSGRYRKYNGTLSDMGYLLSIFFRKANEKAFENNYINQDQKKTEENLLDDILSIYNFSSKQTPDDLAAHTATMEEYRRGETIAHEDMDWN